MGSTDSKLQGTVKTSAEQELEPSTHRATKHKPALAAWGNIAYCLFLGSDDKLWFTSKTFTDTSWESCVHFTDSNTTGASAIGVFNNSLHAVISRSGSQDLIHYQYDMSIKTWGKRAFLGQKVGGPDLSPSSLIEFKGALYCVYNSKDGNRLQIQSWNDLQGWSDPTRLDHHWTFAEPSIFVTNGKLRILYIAENPGRKMMGLVFDEIAGSWNPEVPPDESSRFGLTVTSVDPLGSAWVVFQSNVDTGQFGIAQYSNGSWDAVQWTSIASVHTPALTIINNSIFAVWSSRNGGVLMWTTCAIGSLFDPDRWMSALPPSTPLSSLTIPGTHESCITSSIPWVGCQFLTLTQQLTMGIRAFDFRVGDIDGQLLVTHDGSKANWPYSLTLNQALSEIYDWLKSHHTEALLVQFKEEASNSNGTMGKRLITLFKTSEHSHYWVLENAAPTLQTCAGKIQLLRRFGIPSGLNTPFGIDLSGDWKDNEEDFTLKSPFPITVQDRYLCDDINIKWTYIEAMLNKAQSNLSPNTYFINYTSATRFPTQYTPYVVAVKGFQPIRMEFEDRPAHVIGINERLATYFAAKRGKNRFGVIMMDFPESQSELIRKILAMNF